MEDETTYHPLTQCTFAMEFWNIPRTLTGVKLPTLCPRTWARDLLESSFCSEEEGHDDVRYVVLMEK
jgi:hypothetical protein